MATIKFIIKKDGTIVADVDGVQGRACEDITKLFVDALGTAISVEEKPEYYSQLDGIETSTGNN